MSYAKIFSTSDVIVHNIGLPSKEELLIIALGLGGSGNNYDPLNPTTSDVVLPFVISGIVAGPQVPQGPGPQGPQVPPGNKIITSNSKFCPQYGTTGQICDHIPGKIVQDYCYIIEREKKVSEILVNVMLCVECMRSHAFGMLIMIYSTA